MGTFGYVLPFVLAEDEEQSPWEPFHVSAGFDRSSSTVTAGGTFNWGGQAFPSSSDPEGLLKIICREIVKNVNLPIQTSFGKLGMCTVIMNPSVAQGIARGGYSKKDAERYLFERSRVTIGQLSFESKYGSGGGGSETIREKVAKGRDLPKEWADLEDRPDVTVPVMVYPGLIHIIVCGDRTRNKAMVFYTCYNRPTTKEIKLSESWNRVVQTRGYPSL